MSVAPVLEEPNESTPEGPQTPGTVLAWAADSPRPVGSSFGDAVFQGLSATEVDVQSTLARTFVRVADTLSEQFDLDEMLHHLMDVCVQLVDGSEVSIVLEDDHAALRVVASSSERKGVIEQYQIEHGEGPTIDAYKSGELNLCDDLSNELSPWPKFAQLARAVGYTSVRSVPLRWRNETIGVVSIAETKSVPRSLVRDVLISALADSTTIGILNRRAYANVSELSQQLQGALTSRVLIEQAKGAVAARLCIAPDAAFEMLRRYARSTNRSLNDVAGAVLDGGLATHDLWNTRRASAARKAKVKK
jgi:GAF domain-containing protein